MIGVTRDSGAVEKGKLTGKITGVPGENSNRATYRSSGATVRTFHSLAMRGDVHCAGVICSLYLARIPSERSLASSATASRYLSSAGTGDVHYVCVT